MSKPDERRIGLLTPCNVSDQRPSHIKAGINSSHRKSEWITKLVALIRATVSAPERAMTHEVPFNRAGMATAATNTVSTPAPAMNPPITVKTFFSQPSSPGTAARICTSVVPMSEGLPATMAAAER